MSQILIVSSRRHTTKRLAQRLEALKMSPMLVSNRRLALREVRQQAPDLVLLDLLSGRVNWARLVKRLRRSYDGPLVALAGPGGIEVEAEVEAVVVHPWHAQLLQQVIQEVLQHHPTEVCVGPLRLNLRQRTVKAPHHHSPQPLAPKVFELLRRLMCASGQVVSREELMQDVWQANLSEKRGTLDVHVRWAREVIEPNPSHPTYLLTVRGEGYRLVPPGG